MPPDPNCPFGPLFTELRANLNLLAKAQGMLLSPWNMAEIALDFKSMISPERLIQPDLVILFEGQGVG